MNINLSFVASTLDEFQSAYQWLKEQKETTVVSKVSPPPPASFQAGAKNREYGPRAKEWMEKRGESRFKRTAAEIAEFGEDFEAIASARFAKAELFGDDETTPLVPDDGEDVFA